jgi:hypothetical protein
VQVDEDSDVYGSLDPSLTLLMHGVETDWIEEEMADDDDFRSSLHDPKKADDDDLRFHNCQKIFGTKQSKEYQNFAVIWLQLMKVKSQPNAQREERLKEKKGR